MDSGSLQTASTYLNNLLLARGLLRNGKSIEFTSLRKSSGGADHTTAKIINLIHDLVIRRDHDAEQRESLATNLRNLRADEGDRTNEMDRLRTKNAELMRISALADGQKRSLEASAQKAEASARELKDQMAKMKSTLDQVRAKCVNHVRKRDMELEKLKKHVVGMQRGAAHSSGMKIVQLNPQPPLPKGAREIRSGGVRVDDENWGLEKETNDLLAALVNETSAENVALRHIVDGTMESLRDLTGLNHTPDGQEVDAEIGIPGQYKQSRVRPQSTQQEALISCEELGEQMNDVLVHCRAILKDPSFVSIEEVQIREDEIIKLREGWEKMASRWKDAVAMMDTWRQRMLEGGDTAHLDELSRLDFSKSMAVMPGTQAIPNTEEKSSPMSDDESEALEEEEADANIDQDIDGTEDDLDTRLDAVRSPPYKRLASSPAKRGLRLPKPVTTFTEIAGNAQRKQSHPTEDIFTSSSADSGIGSLAGSVETDTFLGKTPSAVSSRTKSRSPPLSVAEKLAMIEIEAREAEESRQEQENRHKRKASTSSGRKKANRRRSTLSPEELAHLMGVE